MHRGGYIAGGDGNVSMRLDERRLLTTPTGLNKGFLEPRNLVVTDLEGVRLEGELEPSSEVRLHVRAYRVRPDVEAVVHAHPPLCTAFSLAGVSLAKCVLPEIVIQLGAIPTAPYATPGTESLPEAVADYLSRYDAVIMERHGSITVGRDLNDAYNKLEKIEHTAKITLAAMQLGEVSPLPPEELERLRSHGHGAVSAEICSECGARWSCRLQVRIPDWVQRMGRDEAIAEEVLRELEARDG